jgi:inner membrane transporter RhtA
MARGTVLGEVRPGPAPEEGAPASTSSAPAAGGSGPRLVALFVLNAISQYAGASLAVRAFAAMPAAGVAWIRVLTGAVVLGAWRRPWRGLRGQTAAALLLVVAFGIALAAMNLAFYLAIERLPLGTAVAIEFIGPVLVAAIAARGLRNLTALAVAVGGVATLSRISLSGSPVGVVFAITAGLLWALYIVLAHQVARRGLGTTGLAAAMAAGAVAIAPLAAAPAVESADHGAVVLLAIGAGLLSSVVPYALDQVLLRRLSRGAFALLLSLLPATATVMGLLLLRQVPQPLELLGIGLVVVAVILRTPEAAPLG